MAMSSLASSYLDQAFYNYVSNHSPTILNYRSGTYTYNNLNLQGEYYGRYDNQVTIFVQAYTGTGDVLMGGQGKNTQRDQICGGSGSDIIYGGWASDPSDDGSDALYTGIGGGNFMFGGGGSNHFDAQQWGSGGDYDGLGSVFIGGYDLATDPGSGTSFFNAWVNAWNNNGGSLAASLIDMDESTNKVIASYQADTIITGGGADTIYADDGNDVVFSGGGNDIIYNSRGKDTIFAEGGHDSIYADTIDYVSQYLDGGSGDDYILAGTGSDQIIGGKGDDMLIGGAGNDYYYFMFNEGSDTIVETDSYGTDYIIMEDMTLNDYINTFQSNNDLILHFTSAQTWLTSTINVKDYYIYEAQGQTVEWLYVAGYNFALSQLAPAPSVTTANASVMQVAALDVSALVPMEAGVQLGNFQGEFAGAADADFVRLA